MNFRYEIRITGPSADILSDPVKRRAFDSVDPEFDNSIPKGDPKDLQKTFFNTFLPVFERNSRWAVNRSKVQKLGDMESTRDQERVHFISSVPLESRRAAFISVNPSQGGALLQLLVRLQVVAGLQLGRRGRFGTGPRSLRAARN